MTDLLVSLYDLPEDSVVGGVDKGSDYIIRRALAPEKHIILNWIEGNFSKGWASEASIAMSGQPIRLWIALCGQEICGFACFDATAKGFFGPTGVSEDVQGRGVGGRLLIATLNGMKNEGYGYGVIGGVSDSSFYKKYLEVTEIPNSSPGVYKGMLR